MEQSGRNDEKTRAQMAGQAAGADEARMEQDARTGAGRAALIKSAAQSRMEQDAPRAERKRGRQHSFLRRLLWRVLAVVVLLLIAAVVIAVLLQRARGALGTGLNVEFPDSFASLLPDEETGYSRFDFEEAILGETREETELVVLEQDVQVITRVSQALANIALFEKTQTLISYGTGVYAVDLSGITASQIEVDEEQKTVCVRVLHAALLYVNFDVTRTKSGETKRALFAFGDVKLTPEQDTLLKTSIEGAMREKLSTPEALAAADERALVAVRELLTPLVRAVSDLYSVKVLMD